MEEFNIKSSTIEKALDLIKGFLERAIGPTVDEIGLMWSDNMRFRRARNQVVVFEKAKKIAEEGNIKIKQINLKALFPLLEGISLEEDETLQDMWANLFVNYIDSAKNMTLNVFPGILSQLSTNEVEALKYLNQKTESYKPPVLYTPTYTSTGDAQCNYEEIGNLERLGLIEAEPNLSLNDDRIYDDGSFKYSLTLFGSTFLDACIR